jgi:sec-independent protein translocase protein TatB
MFDIGFQEILLIGIVSLVVLGPEKLPGAVRTAALWIGRLKRQFNTIKTEIEKEVGADEIRRQLRNEEIMAKFKQTQAQVNNTISSLKNDADTFTKNVELEAKAASGFNDDGVNAAATTDNNVSTAASAAADTNATAVTPTPTPTEPTAATPASADATAH